MLKSYTSPISLTPRDGSDFAPGHSLVYVKRTASGYFCVYVDEKYFRMFQSVDNLPTEIKEKLLLIHSVSENFLDGKGMPPEILADVGWQVIGGSWYQFVLSNKLLNELKGLPLTSGTVPVDVADDVFDEIIMYGIVEAKRKASNQHDTGRTSQETCERDS